MIKTFIFGLILGLAGVAALVYFIPAVDLHREPSLIAVQPNGGNREVFHINLPQDRIFAGMRSGEQSRNFPAQLEWPDEEFLDGLSSEVFKIRNTDDDVVGLAARLSSLRDVSGSFIQWTVHLPARGTMFVRMHMTPEDDGYRGGLLVAGTREFEVLNGEIREYFNKEAKDSEFDISARIELVTAFVGTLGDER